MKVVKVSAAFSRYRDGNLLLFAENVLAAFIANTALTELYPPSVASIAELRQAIDAFRIGYTAALSKGTDRIAIRNERRVDLVRVLTTMAHQVETLAVKTPSVIVNSGFEASRPYGSSSHHGGVDAPRLSLKHGDFPGIIIASSPQVQRAVSLEMQITEGDPSNQEGWKFQGVHTKASRMEIGNLESGKVYWFRARGHGAAGPGPWSDPVCLRAL